VLAASTGVAVEAAAQQATTQAGTVVGQVVNVATKTPLANVMVLVKGTELRTGTNADGRFAIRNVPAGSHTLRVQLLGYAPEEQTVNVVAGQTATLDFSMKELPYAIAPVVVTALGVERKEKSLGYAVQTISPDKLAKIPETTMMQALAGQSAGVSVTSSSGRPGAGARITIRGETSFSGNTQPLFVIDGVPVSTEMDGPSNALGTGSAGSRQMDIDMENVAELTVLRGAAATALYGSRAANGAIVIKTKQGRSGQPLTFNFNSEVRFDRPIIEGYITNWAAGSRGYFCNGKLASQGGWCEPGYPGTNPATTSNWGPNIDSIPQVVFDSLGPIRIRDARADFYKTGLTSNNSIRGSGSMGDFGTYTLGVSYLNQGGVNPVEKLDRLNMNGNVSFSLGNRLMSTTSIQRIRSENPYSDQAYDGVDHALINLPPTTDARTGYMPDGSPVMLGTSSPSIQWLIDNEYNTETTNRGVASQQFRLTVGPGI
jgi:TonB-dependent SusC/RagA subfamily outer membrane receptor